MIWPFNRKKREAEEHQRIAEEELEARKRRRLEEERAEERRSRAMDDGPFYAFDDEGICGGGE